MNVPIYKFTNFRILYPYLFIALAAIPYGIVVNYIMLPHAVVGGGVTGICEIIYFLTSHLSPSVDGGSWLGIVCPVPIWLSQLLINGVLLLAAIFTVGWRVCARTVYCIFCLTLWLKVLPPVEVCPIADPLLALLIGGVMNGAGMAFIFFNGGSTGGTDILALIIHKYRPWALGRILMVFDFLIMGSAYFLPEVHSIGKVACALAYTFVATSTIDCVMSMLTSPSVAGNH